MQIVNCSQKLSALSEARKDKTISLITSSRVIVNRPRPVPIIGITKLSLLQQ